MLKYSWNDLHQREYMIGEAKRVFNEVLTRVFNMYLHTLLKHTRCIQWEINYHGLLVNRNVWNRKN